jgi:hypothetical protein
MRKFLFSLLLSIVTLGLATANAAEASNVRIEFVNPKHFSDFRIQGRNEIASVPIFREKISHYLSPTVAKRYPGATLSLKFTDINLAGRLNTSDTRRLNNVRIEREGALPLRLDFDYALSDSRGKVLESGSKSLVDSDYLRRYVNYPISLRGSPLFYERETISRWLNSETLASPSIAGK